MPFLARSQRPPHPSHTFKSTQKCFISCLQVHTSPIEPRLNSRSDGLAQVAEAPGWRMFALSCLAQCHPQPGVCLSRLVQAGPWETPAPTFALPKSGSRPPDLSMPGPAVHGGSSAVIEPAPTPLSTGNFPQQTDKPKVFPENGLGVYCGSFTFNFR